VSDQKKIYIKVSIPYRAIHDKDPSGYCPPITHEFIDDIRIYPLYAGGINQNAEYEFIIEFPGNIDKDRIKMEVIPEGKDEPIETKWEKVVKKE
jgi:hypothetical protein